LRHPINSGPISPRRMQTVAKAMSAIIMANLNKLNLLMCEYICTHIVAFIHHVLSQAAP
jgi:hypothetical protein